MMESLSKEEFARVAITLWAIWYARWKVIFEGEFESPLSTHALGYQYTVTCQGQGRYDKAPEVDHPAGGMCED
jgi:hypothetical protein